MGGGEGVGRGKREKGSNEDGIVVDLGMQNAKKIKGDKENNGDQISEVVVTSRDWSQTFK